MSDNKSSRRINILRDSVARRIAAGEVIDRPQAVVRELLDNSIDASSTDISLFIKGGGIEEIRVTDNGSGMDRENLKKCFLPHATSKINDFDDIYKTRTLGFRGEALSSIAACSRLSITSSVDDNSQANRIDINNGSIVREEPAHGRKGTIIQVRDLFYSMPGRRNFLKAPSAESSMCRTTFIEKSLPQTDISFRYFVDDKMRLFLPPSDLKTRVLSAYGSLFNKDLMSSFEDESEGIKLTAAAGTPSLYRKDRKYIHVFINNRRINDYSLVQAIDYAYSSYLPGGCHPVCFLFLDIPPEHVDFNIHPAKREVKFRNLPGIHHFVTEASGKFLSTRNSFTVKNFPEKKSYTVNQKNLELSYRTPVHKPVHQPVPEHGILNRKPASASVFRDKNLPEIAEEISETSVNLQPEHKSLVFLGQLFNLFLIFEYGSNLLLIDQHAAHERIIFNSLSEDKPDIQELLVPIRLSTDRDSGRNILENIDSYKRMGFDFQQTAEGDWLLNTMPAACTGFEDSIVEFFQSRVKTESELKKKLYAMISCKAAIKDGDSIDDIAAVELAVKVLEMENPRCPHGRPVIQLLSREQLFKMFGRTF